MKVRDTNYVADFHDFVSRAQITKVRDTKSWKSAT